METTHPRWLDVSFAVSAVAIVALFGLSVVREGRRPARMDQRLVPALGVVDRCESCHEADGHPGSLLTNHPVDRFGCTPCHGGQGLATDRVNAHESRPDWERPLFSKAEREAACGRCHLGQEVLGAPLLSRGRRALVERGCAGCHELPGLGAPAIAPSLDGLADKVRPAWVRGWLTEPGLLDDRRVMPLFDLSSDEVEALVGFLFSLPGPELSPEPTGVKGDADRGKAAVARRRCATCHRVEGRGGSLGPPLDTAGAKLDPKWLFNYLSDTHRIRPGTRMPGFRLSAEEAADITAYAAEQWVPDTVALPWSRFAGEARRERAEEGKKLFLERGCRGCHFVSGLPFARVAPPLVDFSSRRLGELPGGTGSGAPVDLPGWVTRKITTPRGFDVVGAHPSSMPTFELKAGEAQTIGVAIASMRAALPPVGYSRGTRDTGDPATPPGATGQLITRFRCFVCHRIGGAGGDVSRVPLDGAGSRLNRPWLDRFLREPLTVRMDQAERMPVLGLDEGEAARAAGWIEATLGDDRLRADAPASAEEVEVGKKLFGERGCPTCHVAEGHGTMKGPVLDGARDRLSFAYAVGLLRLGPAVVPERRHPDPVHPLAEARAMAAYVTSLAPARGMEPASDPKEEKGH